MINLTLSLEQVNQILGILGKAPYEQSAGLIVLIREQAIPQLPKEEPAKQESAEEENKES